MNIAVFASGNGSNAENIIRYFQCAGRSAKVAVVICNRENAYVVTRAANLGVPVEIITRSQLDDPVFFTRLMEKYDIGFIALAGFLLMIPPFVISDFKDRIVNIHPSLLPKYGGKGMYGHRIHEAVVAAREPVTGITVHKVSEACDGGEVVFQASVEVLPQDTPEDVETKIHRLEKEHYPEVIAGMLDALAD